MHKLCANKSSAQVFCHLVKEGGLQTPTVLEQGRNITLLLNKNPHPRGRYTLNMEEKRGERGRGKGTMTGLGVQRIHRTQK